MTESGRDIRRAARDGGFTGRTVGRARGFVQANLVALPADAAAGFVAFCEANPVACPVLGVGSQGDPRLPGLGEDLDVRTDLPGYLLHRGGVAVPVTDLRATWRADWVAVAIGCWFGAEAALAAHGVRLRHVELGLQGPLFRTAKAAHPAGRFAGPIVVSMRPFASADVPRVEAITARLPRSHGAPIHRGDPAALGIADPTRPDWGEVLLPDPGEELLFWACGLTALAALEAAGLPEFATHAPGCMLVTDLPEEIPPWP
jgi:uncharacterized protein YcsI (UPF0317 family)